MLGWEVLVYRESDYLKAEAENDPAGGVPLIRWSTGIGGLKWIDELVQDEQATDLGSDGLLAKYSVPASVFVPIIRKGLPKNEDPPVFGDDYYIPPGWNGKVRILEEKVGALANDETLIIEAWDQS